jgi:hypothetical protein
VAVIRRAVAAVTVLLMAWAPRWVVCLPPYYAHT